MDLLIAKHPHDEQMIDLMLDENTVYATINKDFFSFELLSELNHYDFLECVLTTKIDYEDMCGATEQALAADKARAV